MEVVNCFRVVRPKELQKTLMSAPDGTLGLLIPLLQPERYRKPSECVVMTDMIFPVELFRLAQCFAKCLLSQRKFIGPDEASS